MGAVWLWNGRPLIDDGKVAIEDDCCCCFGCSCNICGPCNTRVPRQFNVSIANHGNANGDHIVTYDGQGSSDLCGAASTTIRVECHWNKSFSNPGADDLAILTVQLMIDDTSGPMPPPYSLTPKIGVELGWAVPPSECFIENYTVNCGDVDEDLDGGDITITSRPEGGYVGGAGPDPTTPRLDLYWCASGHITTSFWRGGASTGVSGDGWWTFNWDGGGSFWYIHKFGENSGVDYFKGGSIYSDPFDTVYTGHGKYAGESIVLSRCCG